MWLLAVFIFMVSVWSAFSVYLGAYLETELRASANAISVVFLVSGVCFTLGSLFIPRVIEHRSKRRVHGIVAVLLGINLLGVGIVYTTIPAAAIFVGMTALLGVSLYLITGILLLDSLPDARGAVMALQAAGTEVGVSFGAAWGGAALIVSDNSYVDLYRSLAILLPLVIICLLMSARTARSGIETLGDNELAVNPGM